MKLSEMPFFEKIDKQTLLRPIAEVSPKLQMNGSTEAILSDCAGVCDYAADLIRLSAGGKILTFRGSDLQLMQLDGGEAVIHGQIVSVEYR